MFDSGIGQLQISDDEKNELRVGMASRLNALALDYEEMAARLRRDRDNVIREMLANGMTAQQVADRVGVGVGDVMATIAAPAGR
jgi:hypothetical protein